MAKNERAPLITPYVPSIPSAVKSASNTIEGLGMQVNIAGSSGEGDVLNFLHKASMVCNFAASRCNPLNVRLDLRVQMASIMFMAIEY